MRWLWSTGEPRIRLTAYELGRRLEQARAEARREARAECAQADQVRRAAALAGRRAAAERVLDRISQLEGNPFTDLARRGLLVDLPAQVNGDLHEEAFRAVIDDEIWRLRLDAPAALHGRSDS